MDFIQSQNENQLNQFDLMLCPICNRTVPNIQAFVDPDNNKAYVSLKCEYQKKIGVIPLEKFLNEYALLESEMNKQLIPDIDTMNRYKITEEKGLNEDEIMKLEHLKIESKNKKCNFHEEQNEEESNKETLYCGNCCKGICKDCYIEHQNFDNSHFISNHELELVRQCKEQHHGEAVNFQCKNCFSVYCDRCVKIEEDFRDQSKKRCSFCNEINNNRAEVLFRYSQKREEIKQNKQWEEIKKKYEAKKEEINTIAKGLVEEYDKKINEIIRQKNKFQSQVDEHLKNIDMIFALIKVLYSNFKKSRIYQNFNIINNYDNNTNFDEEKYSPFKDTSNLNAYKESILSFLKNHSLLKRSNNSFFIMKNVKTFQDHIIQSVIWNPHFEDYSCLLKDTRNNTSNLWNCTLNSTPSNAVQTIYFEKEIIDVLVLDEKYLIGYDKNSIYIYEYHQSPNKGYSKVIEPFIFPDQCCKKMYFFGDVDFIYINYEKTIKTCKFKPTAAGPKRFKESQDPIAIQNKCNVICPIAGQSANIIAYNDGDRLIVKNVKRKKEMASVQYENVDKNILGFTNDTILAILSIITKEEKSILIVSYTNAIVVYLLSEKMDSLLPITYIKYKSICSFYKLNNIIIGVDSYKGIDGNSKNVIIEINNTPENKDKYYINLRDINLYGKIGFSKISYTQDITIFMNNLIIRCDNNRDYSEREKRFKPVFLDI